MEGVVLHNPTQGKYFSALYFVLNRVKDFKPVVATLYPNMGQVPPPPPPCLGIGMPLGLPYADLIRSFTTGSGTSILLRWSMQS